MDLLVAPFPGPWTDRAPVEIVERKGLGHPDTMCDALAEELSLALSEFYCARFDHILHHNVDKVLLWGGQSSPRYGGGEVLEPIEVFLAGRAVREHRGVRVPVDELAQETAARWVREHLRFVDPTRHLRVHALVRPGSIELSSLFAAGQAAVLSNDTSCGVGHWPATRLERCVLAVAHHLNSAAVRRSHPFVGEDIKVMGVRRDDAIALTVACAFVDRFVWHVADYGDKRRQLLELAHAAAHTALGHDVEIEVNTADDLARERVYLTVTGTSAEAGDDGSAGRGNRVGGLITPFRPMTMEAAAGKNPISHVGKIYNVLAREVCETVVRALPEVAAAECYLVSQIGRPLQEPQIVQVRLAMRGDTEVDPLRPQVAAIVQRHLATADTLWRRLLRREVALF